MNGVLTLKNASDTWSDFIALGKTDKDHLLFLERLVEKTFEEECVCLNPFKHEAPAFLYWFFKKDCLREDWNPLTIERDIHGRMQDKTHYFSAMRKLIFEKVRDFLFSKRAILRSDEECKYEDRQAILRLDLFLNIQNKLRMFEYHSYRMQTRLDETSLTNKCFQGCIWAYNGS